MPREAIEPRDSCQIRSEELRVRYSLAGLSRIPGADRRGAAASTAGRKLTAGSYLSQAFLPQLFEGLLRLLQIAQSHAVQNVRRLGELDLSVLDYLPAVAPRVAKV